MCYSNSSVSALTQVERDNFQSFLPTLVIHQWTTCVLCILILCSSLLLTPPPSSYICSPLNLFSPPFFYRSFSPSPSLSLTTSVNPSFCSYSYYKNISDFTLSLSCSHSLCLLNCMAKLSYTLSVAMPFSAPCFDILLYLLITHHPHYSILSLTLTQRLGKGWK